MPETSSAASRAKRPDSTAVLLINLGSPDEPKPAAVRRYLREFLLDQRVVELPRLVWRPLLEGLILPARAARSAAKYARIWTDEGSPLKTHSARQARLLRGYLGHAGRRVTVDYAMRYGQPSIPNVLDRLAAAGKTHFLLLPLYPQCAASTTASAFDAVFAWLKTRRNPPEIRTVRGFAADPAYLDALAESVHEHWMRNGHPDSAYRLLMSFHGLPQKRIEQGDPYRDECQETARQLAERLALRDGESQMVFQSRFGRAAWLQPYTAPTLAALARQGVRRVDVLCPGFPADCLETLEEIAVEGKKAFLQAGGRDYHYIPALNERDRWIHALARIAERHLQGWPGSARTACQEKQAVNGGFQDN